MKPCWKCPALGKLAQHPNPCPCRCHGRRSKFNARRVSIDGITFDSKREGNYYLQLKQARGSGELLYFLVHAPIHLPGGVRYVCDFVEFWKTGQVVFRDVKGHRTRLYLTKKKMIEALYGIQIQEA